MTSVVNGTLDLGRMRRDRLAKVQAGMEGTGFDALVLSGNSAVRYVSGADVMNVEVSRTPYEPTIAGRAAEGQPHLFTPYPEGAPPDLPSDHVHAPLLVEFDEGVAALAGVR